MTRAFVGIGANLGQPLAQLRNAAAQLQNSPGIDRVECSSIFRSAPLGPPGQEDYLNAVLGVDTGLDALALLHLLQDLEARAGRRRGERWGPRTLDLDLLLFGDTHMSSLTLTLPHPRLGERNFVLQPLAELCGTDWRLPWGLSIGEQLRRCPENPLTTTDLTWELPRHRLEAAQ